MSLIKAYALKKTDILRGQNSFLKVIKDSKQFTTDNIKAFIKINTIEESESQCPQNDSFVKAGFLISKKVILKSVRRNYYKRILKEIYRTNKNHYFGGLKSNKLEVVFNLKKNIETDINKFKFNAAQKEMREILFKIAQFLLRN
jgi:ribonuclease P protein component